MNWGGLSTNTLNPGDLSEPSVIVYVWIGPRGLYQPLVSFFPPETFFLAESLTFKAEEKLNMKPAEKSEAGWRREKRDCVKDLEVEIENA